MSRTFTVSDELYARLEAEARSRAIDTLEEFLDRTQGSRAERARREDVVRDIDDLGERLVARYGQVP